MTKRLARIAAYLAGPLLALLIWSFSSLPIAERQTLGILAWVFLWWVFEPIPLPVTALLVPLLATLFNVVPESNVWVAFSNPVIYLFLGSFWIARAFEVHGCDERIALRLLSFPIIQKRTSRVVWVVLFLSGGLSMLLSNTATTALMLPLVSALSLRMGTNNPKAQASLLLAVAYAASIGGIGTPVGSPPNILALGFLSSFSGEKINFFEWMRVGIPLAVILLGILGLITLRSLPPSERRRPVDITSIRNRLREIGDWNRAQVMTVFVLALAFSLWMLPDLLTYALGENNTLAQWTESRFSEAWVALFAASLLFVLPGQSGQSVLTWKDARQIDWGTLLLFGGGLSLGQLMTDSNLALRVSEGLPLEWLAAHAWLFIPFVVIFCIFLSEILSNTAAVGILLPLIMPLAVAAGIGQHATTFAVALGCSLAFMMPVGTPPNALVYGTGRIPLQLMIRRGFALNLIATLAISFLLYLYF